MSVEVFHEIRIVRGFPRAHGERSSYRAFRLGDPTGTMAQGRTPVDALTRLLRILFEESDGRPVWILLGGLASHWTGPPFGLSSALSTISTY